MGATVGHEESHSLWEGMEVKFYVIRLKAEERDELTRLVKTGREAAYRRRNAQILLLADQGEHGPGQRDTEIGEQVG